MWVARCAVTGILGEAVADGGRQALAQIQSPCSAGVGSMPCWVCGMIPRCMGKVGRAKALRLNADGGDACGYCSSLGAPP